LGVIRKLSHLGLETIKKTNCKDTKIFLKNKRKFYGNSQKNKNQKHALPLAFFPTIFLNISSKKSEILLYFISVDINLV